MIDRLACDFTQCFLFERKRALFELEHARVLLHERVLRFRENTDQVLKRQLVERGDHGDASDELRNHAELVQVLRQHLRQQLGLRRLAVLGKLDGKSHAAASYALGDDVCQADERTAKDEQDVRGVDVDKLLLGMLAPTLRRHGRLAAFDDLQQSLLNALAGHIARDGQVLRFARDLVDLVDVEMPISARPMSKSAAVMSLSRMFSTSSPT